MFSLLDFPTLVAGMLTQMTGLSKDITDFTEGGVVRSILEANAIEINRQNLMIYQGVREGIETGTYKNFSFNRLPATTAGGFVRFSRGQPVGSVTIPQGTRIKVPGSSTRVYTTRLVLSMVDGVASLDVPVLCETAGASGNTAAGTVVEVVGTLPFEAAVSNPAPFLNGVEQESDEDRRDRFRRYIAGLSRGTANALEAAARGVYLTDLNGNVIERVTGVLVREPFRENVEGLLGLVEIYVDNGSGSSSQELLDAVTAILVGSKSAEGVIMPGWLSAGIDLSVKGVTAQPLDVIARITVLPGFDTALSLLQVQQAVTLYLQGLQVFQPAVFAELISVVMYVEGISDVAFQTPIANVVTTFDKRITPGSVVIQG